MFRALPRGILLVTSKMDQDIVLVISSEIPLGFLANIPHEITDMNSARNDFKFFLRKSSEDF